MKFRNLFLVLGILFTGIADAAPQGKSVDDVIRHYAEGVKLRLKPHFDFVGATWPPREIALVAIKEARQMELWVKGNRGWQHVRDYRIKGMSGTLGPKLKQGDRQVPEGFYHIVRMNPNSAFHLSMKIDYPNDFDREQAQRERRVQLGGDIFIHGADVSTGCLALGDTAIEEVFVLTALAGPDKVSVLIAPQDFRLRPVEAKSGEPVWVADLKRQIAKGLTAFDRGKAVR